MMSSTHTLVIDSQPIMREALSQLLYETIPNVQVLQAPSATFAIQLVRNHNINMVVLDVDLEGSDGFEFVRRARAYGYTGRILFVSSNKHPMYSETAKLLGANGYVSKLENTLVLKEAVLSVSRGHSVFKKTDNLKKRNTTLSKRETVVFNYLIKGYSNKKISEVLSLSSKTISTYKARILDKYKVDSIVELMRIQQHIHIDLNEARKDAA
ncbi:response regulator [Vibrio sp. TRT 2004]|uniref:response regulator n=1 Tax=Vibrio sp. TRT 2004 TaxID=3418506 RepID=UPI003CE6DFB1